MTEKKVLALIPAYNEAAAIQDVVLRVRDCLPVLVVDDGSVDDTAALAEAAGAVSLMAAYKIKERLAGKKVVMIMSGGNLNMDALKTALVC